MTRQEPLNARPCWLISVASGSPNVHPPPLALDEDRYHCSTRTMYRLLEQAGQSRERRNQLMHLAYQKPELLASEPNQLWSWDITKLLGPAK